MVRARVSCPAQLPTAIFPTYYQSNSNRLEPSLLRPVLQRLGQYSRQISQITAKMIQKALRLHLGVWNNYSHLDKYFLWVENEKWSTTWSQRTNKRRSSNSTSTARNSRNLCSLQHDSSSPSRHSLSKHSTTLWQGHDRHHSPPMDQHLGFLPPSCIQTKQHNTNNQRFPNQLTTPTTKWDTKTTNK